MYSTQFGLAINAIRDDEDKAEAMGIPTLVYKRIGWGVAAVFMGAIGAIAGNMAGFIDKEVAYPIPTFGIFMVAMVLLGGKGTLWGPVVGAIIFHVVKEATWTYLLRSAVDCAGSYSDHQYRLFPAGSYGLAANQISRNVRYCCR